MPPNANDSLTATVEGGAGHHLQLRPVGADHRSLATEASADRTLTWRLVYTSEGRTLEGTVIERFRSSGCSLVSWSKQVKDIDHSRRWSQPSPWA